MGRCEFGGGVGLGNPHSDVLQATEHSNQVLRTERERQMGLWGGCTKGEQSADPRTDPSVAPHLMLLPL